MYYEYDLGKQMTYAHVNSRWKVAAIFESDSGFGQVSFVNGISTYNGGKHVDYIVQQITKGLTDIILKKEKNLKSGDSMNSIIKNCLTVFIDSVIEDPSFTSQVKDSLTTKLTDFGSTCTLTSDFIQKFSKSGIVEDVITNAQFKQQTALKKTDGKKTKICMLIS